MPSGGDPPIMIKRAVAEHLEVLRLPLLFGIRVIEAIHHTDTFEGLLLDAVDFSWLRNVGGFQNGWNDVDDVVELRANATFILDPGWPGNDDGVACSAEVRCDLFA